MRLHLLCRNIRAVALNLCLILPSQGLDFIRFHKGTGYFCVFACDHLMKAVWRTAYSAGKCVGNEVNVFSYAREKQV